MCVETGVRLFNENSFEWTVKLRILVVKKTSFFAYN